MRPAPARAAVLPPRPWWRIAVSAGRGRGRRHRSRPQRPRRQPAGRALRVPPTSSATCDRAGTSSSAIRSAAPWPHRRSPTTRGFARRAVLLDPVLEIPEADFEAVLPTSSPNATSTHGPDPSRQPELAPGRHPSQARGLGRVRTRDRRGGAAREPPVGSCAPAHDPGWRSSAATPPTVRYSPAATIRATAGFPALGTRRTATTRTPFSRPLDARL